MSDEEMPSIYKEIKETANESVDLAIAWDPEYFHRQQIIDMRADNDDLWFDYRPHMINELLADIKQNEKVFQYVSDELKMIKTLLSKLSNRMVTM